MNIMSDQQYAAHACAIAFAGKLNKLDLSMCKRAKSVPADARAAASAAMRCALASMPCEDGISARIEDADASRKNAAPSALGMAAAAYSAALGYIQDLWRGFEDVPMDPETECIDEPYLRFPAGTPRTEIWTWFENEFGVSVARDLIDD